MTEPKRRKANRSSFGSTRKLPSGRWQARYRDEAGKPMTAPETFDTKQAALDHLAAVRSDRSRGSYLDHRAGAVDFRDYALEWVNNGGSRGKLAPRTRSLYLDLLTRHIAPEDHRPSLAGLDLAAIRPETIRRWHTGLRKRLAEASRAGTGETTLRQAYALVRAILGTAVTDRRISSNPCTIVRAGMAESPERPLLSVPEFAAVVERMPEHHRPALVLAFGGHLRLGELLGLQRGDVDLAAGTLKVARQVVTIRDLDPITGSVTTRTETTATKTGRVRIVQLPPIVVEAMRDHLSASRGFAKAPLFLQRDGRPFTRSQLQQAWRKAANAAGFPEAHLHDVRHASLTVAAQSGATLAELQQRAGHSTAVAALRYQHAAQERGAVVAAGISAALKAGSEGLVARGWHGRQSKAEEAAGPPSTKPLVRALVGPTRG